jgi:hypothetical protein
MNDEPDWYCPLLKRTIEEGRCYDINVERLGYFKPDTLADAQRRTGLTVEEVSAVCEACPNLPLRSEAEGRD